MRIWLRGMALPILSLVVVLSGCSLGQATVSSTPPPTPSASPTNPTTAQVTLPSIASPTPVAQNEAFRLFLPQPGSEAAPGFIVEGEARVFEAAFSWKLEDGHNLLAEGHEMANGGAPAWGHFRFTIHYDKASQSDMTLILFTNSPKDGSVANPLVVPLKAPASRVQNQLSG